MLWMEMIWLRTARFETNDVFALLQDYARQVVAEPGLVDVHVFGNACRPTDLALSMGWSIEPPSRQGSRAGLTISEALRSFGLVEHSIWLERHQN
jgi:hypothetical protein